MDSWISRAREDPGLRPGPGNRTSSSRESTVGPLAHLLAQRQLRVSCLEPAPHGGLNPLLGLRLAHTLDEETGIATKVVGRREGDGVDAFLDDGLARRWESADPMRKRPDELAESSAGNARLIQP